MSLSKAANTTKDGDSKIEKKPLTEEEKKVYIRNKFTPSATELQRQQMADLLKNPEKEVEISRPEKRALSPPPELVSNIAGSSAGAGSGEFHVYKQARRKEFERMKMFEEEEQKEATEKDFALQKSIHDAKDNAKTEKNRLKRLKRKGIKGKGKKTDTPTPHPTGLASSPASTEVNAEVSKETPSVPATITEPKGLEIVDDDF